MNIFCKALCEAIRDNPMQFEAKSFHTMLEFLWYFYTQYFPISDDSIRSSFDELEYILKTLSHKRKRKLLHHIHHLCCEYERTAFIHGLQAGAQLMLEIINE